MKTNFLSIITVGAACSMLAASAPAQSDSQSRDSSGTDKSWSSKHLSATGRATEQSVRCTKLIGAQVNDSTHNRLGQIQDVIVNQNSGKIDFALISMNAGEPTPGGKLVPVPWSLLKTSESSQYATSSEQPLFTLNVDQDKLNKAPALEGADVNQSGWRQRVYSYYGLQPDASMGSAESPQGEIKGQPARKLQESSQPPNQ